MRQNLLAVTLTGAAMIALAPLAMASGIDGTGVVGSCPDVGKIKISPGLVNGGTTAATIKIGAKSPKVGGGCTGGSGDGAHVVALKAAGLGTSATNDCTNL